MYDIREELMQKMVSDLKKEQNRYKIMSDEEFYNSDYGEKRRKRNQTCSGVVYMHCLMPESAKNLLGVYFHKKDIAISVPKDFENFKTDIVVEIKEKEVFNNSYYDYRVVRKDHDEMYSDTKKLILEMLDYASEHIV